MIPFQPHLYVFRTQYFDLSYYFLFFFLAVLFGFYIAHTEARRVKFNINDFYMMCFFGIVGAWIGGRVLVFSFGGWDHYNLIDVMNTQVSGLSSPGMLIGAFVFVLVYSIYKRFSPFKIAEFCDIVVPSLVFGAFMVRIGQFIIGWPLGKESTLPWASDYMLRGVLIHPYTLYLSLAGLFIFILLSEIKLHKKFDGYVAAWFVIIYSGSRILLDYFRYGHGNFFGTSVSWIFGGLLIVFTIFLIFITSSFKKYGMTYGSYKNLLNIISSTEGIFGTLRLLYLLFKWVLGLKNPYVVKIGLYEMQNKSKSFSQSKNKNAKSNFLTFKEIREVTYELKRQGLFLVIFDGEELLRRKDASRILEYIKSEGLKIFIETDGTLLQNREFSRIKRYVDMFFISLGKLRQSNNEVKRCVQLCKKENIKFSFLLFVSGRLLNGKNLKNTIDNLMGFEPIFINIMCFFDSKNYSTSKRNNLVKLAESKLKPLILPGHIYLEGTPLCWSNHKRNCPAISEDFFYISPIGNIKVCPFSDYVLGNIRKKPIEDILIDKHNSKLFKLTPNECLVEIGGLR